MTVPGSVITKDLIAQHGLSDEEYKKIVEILGREPNLTELGMFSVMWSEHCSYKSSRVHLRKLPTTGPRVVQGPGENAGAVDIGDGLCAVFKMESHNHPSFIEPYQMSSPKPRSRMPCATCAWPRNSNWPPPNRPS